MREVVVGPRKLPEKDDWLFPQLGCWKKKSASTFKKISGLKSIFADEPWLPNGFFPLFWRMGSNVSRVRCLIYHVWITLNWDPFWSFESVPLEDFDWLLNLFLEKSKVPWPTIGCMKLEKPLRKSPKKNKVHATLSHLLKKSKDLPHKNIQKTPNKTSFFTPRAQGKTTSSILIIIKPIPLHFCGVPPTKLPDIEPPYGHAPQ